MSIGCSLQVVADLDPAAVMLTAVVRSGSASVASCTLARLSQHVGATAAALGTMIAVAVLESSSALGPVANCCREVADEQAKPVLACFAVAVVLDLSLLALHGWHIGSVAAMRHVEAEQTRTELDSRAGAGIPVVLGEQHICVVLSGVNSSPWFGSQPDMRVTDSNHDLAGYPWPFAIPTLAEAE